MAIMQSSPLNPFPMSDDDSVEKPAPVVAPVPMPAPVPEAKPAPTPTAPKQNVFVQPATPQETSASMQPHGPLAVFESQGIKLFSNPAIQLPDYVKDMIARLLPWLTVMMCVILAPLVLAGLALGGFLGFITSFYDINMNPFYWLTVVLLIAQLALMITAVSKLLQESRRGWSLLFTAAVLGILTLLTNIFAQFVSPLVALLSGFVVFSIVLYVLFQTRAYYSK